MRSVKEADITPHANAMRTYIIYEFPVKEGGVVKRVVDQSFHAGQDSANIEMDKETSSRQHDDRGSHHFP